MNTRNQLRAYPALIYIALVLICMLSLRPFLVNSGLPEGNDAELHVFRTAELGYSKESGQGYPRWAPNFFHGYGYPIFNYYAPLSYHLGYWLSGGHPESAMAGTLFITILAQCWGIFGAYLLGKTFTNQGGGLVSAAVYAFTPYIQFINPHIRGDIAEVVALAFIPWALWAWAQLWQCKRFIPRYFICAVLFPTLTLLSHNLTGLITMLLLIAYSAWQWVTQQAKWPTVLRALLAGVMVMAVTAFFWLPFFVERSAIQLDVAGDGHYDYRNHFVPWVNLIAVLPKVDWRAATPHYPMSAGALNVMALALSIVLWIWSRLIKNKQEPSGFGFFVAGSAFLLFLVSQDSVIIWETIPGIEYFQFPWRFLGPFAAMVVPVVAWLAFKIVNLLKRISPAIPINVLVILPIILGTAGLYVRPWESLPKSIPSNMVIEYELKGLWRGTTSTNDFVPSTVDMVPGPQDSVIQSFRDGQVDRVNHASLPEGVAVTAIPDKPWINRYKVEAEQSFVLRLFLFDFPGWTASIDGTPVDIEIAHPEGFITLEVPQGQHEVVVAFQDTSVRKIGWGISIVSILGLIVACVLIIVRPDEPNAKQHTNAPIQSFVTGLTIIIVLSIATGIIFAFDKPGVFYEASAIGEASVAHHQQQALLGEQIQLLGYDVTHQSIPAGRTFEVNLFWQAMQPLDQTYQSFVHLVNEQGILVAQSDHLNPGGFPTNLWPSDRYIVDTHRIVIPADAGGELQIHAGIFNIHTGVRLANTDLPSTDYILLDNTIQIQ